MHTIATFNKWLDNRNASCMSMLLVTGEQTDSDYLDTDDGQKYVQVFKHIRLIHILTDSGSISVINTDRIIPRGYFIISIWCLFETFGRLAVTSV